LKIPFVLFVPALATTLSAALAPVIFDNTSGTNIDGFGYFTAGSAWGDELTVAGSKKISSFAFNVGDVSDGSDTGSLTLAFYSVNLGVDGLFQTADDKIGTFLGSVTKSVNLIPGTKVTFTGLSIDVPANFIYTVSTSGSLSYTVHATMDDPTMGADSNDNLWANYGGGLATGADSSSSSEFYGNAQVQVWGTAIVPETNPFWPIIGLVSAAIGGQLLRQRPRAE
jgi:hypothetical protein